MTDLSMKLTVAGATAVAAFAAGGPGIVISHMAIGDGNGVAYTPSENQTSLVREVYRMPVSSVTAISGGTVEIEALLPADTPDASGRPSHGFMMRELGVFAAGGALIGIAAMAAGEKPSPASGSVAAATIKAKLGVSTSAAISLVVDPTTTITLSRQLRLGFMVVDSVANTAPASPAAGATVLVGASPTGTFSGWAHKLAQWTGSEWQARDVLPGFVVVDTTKALDAADRVLRRTSTGWANFVAAVDAYGIAKRAPAGAVNAGVDTSGYLTAADLAGVTNGSTTAVALAAALGITAGTYTPPAGSQAAAGDVKMIAGQTIPAGWLRCDGALISRATYASLFAAIGTTYGAGDGSTTFKLPDTRGLFVRDLDGGAGVDSGRVLGSTQGDAIKSHTHPLSDDVTNFDGRPAAVDIPASSGSAGVVTGASSVEAPYLHAKIPLSDLSSAQQAGGASETRPKNIAFIHIIKT